MSFPQMIQIQFMSLFDIYCHWLNTSPCSHLILVLNLIFTLGVCICVLKAEVPHHCLFTAHTHFLSELQLCCSSALSFSL